MLQLDIRDTQVFLGKCFKAEEGAAAAAQIARVTPLSGRRGSISPSPR